MTATFKYLDSDHSAIPDAGGFSAPQFKDEFCFDGTFDPTQGVRETPVLFRSRRREEDLRKAAEQASKTPDYLPSYQWFSRVTGFYSSVERPSIGFEIRARATAHIPGNRRVF